MKGKTVLALAISIVGVGAEYFLATLGRWVNLKPHYIHLNIKISDLWDFF